MLLGAHWGYWLALGLALVALVVDQVRRYRRRQRVWLAAFLEQQRREDEHQVPYRRDQRIRAIQQRLSRQWGSRAQSEAVHKQIEEQL